MASARRKAIRNIRRLPSLGDQQSWQGCKTLTTNLFEFYIRITFFKHHSGRKISSSIETFSGLLPLVLATCDTNLEKGWHSASSAADQRRDIGEGGEWGGGGGGVTLQKGAERCKGEIYRGVKLSQVVKCFHQLKGYFGTRLPSCNDTHHPMPQRLQNIQHQPSPKITVE